MATETQTLVVDGIVSSANFGTPTTAILANIDGSKISGSTGAVANILCDFDAPLNFLNGATQTIRVEAAKINTKSSTPTIQIELWESGSLVRSSTAVSVTSSTMAEFTLVFNSTELSGDGTNVQVKVIGTNSGTGGQKSAIGIDRIIIDAVIEEVPPVILPDILYGALGTIDDIVWNSLSVQAIVFEDTVVWGSLGVLTHEWNFNNTVVPTIGSVTLTGVATFNGNGALTHNGTVPLILSTGISLPSADNWSICLIYREHGTDTSGYSIPLVFNGSGSDDGFKLFTNSATQADGSVTTYGWLTDTGGDGDATAAAAGLPATNINIWVKILITNSAGTINVTADGTNIADLVRVVNPAVLTSILAQEHTGSQNLEGDIAYLGICTTDVLTYSDFPTIASLTQAV